MGDEVHRIIACHVLFLQEVGGVGFTFGKDRNQHIGAGHFGAARALDVDRGALDHPLEGGGRHSLGAFDIGDQVAEIIVNEFDQRAAQVFGVYRASFENTHRVRLIDQR